MRRRAPMFSKIPSSAASSEPFGAIGSNSSIGASWRRPRLAAASRNMGSIAAFCNNSIRWVRSRLVVRYAWWMARVVVTACSDTMFANRNCSSAAPQKMASQIDDGDVPWLSRSISRETTRGTSLFAWPCRNR